MDEDEQRCDMIDEHLLEVDHSFDVNYWRSLGDSIYNTYSVKIVDFESFRQQRFEDIFHDHSQLFTWLSIADLEQHEGFFDVDLRQLCVLYKIFGQ